MKAWLLETPLLDLFRGRPGRLAWRRRLATSGLSEGDQKRVRTVLRHSRLWRTEKADAADELIARLGDAAADDARERQDLQTPRLAGRQLGRARRRRRSLTARALAATTWLVGAVAVFAAGITLSFHARGPIPERSHYPDDAPLMRAVQEHYWEARDVLSAIGVISPVAGNSRAVAASVLSARPELADRLRLLTREKIPPAATASVEPSVHASFFAPAFVSAPHDVALALALDFEVRLARGETDVAIDDLQAVSDLVLQLRSAGVAGQASAQHVLVNVMLSVPAAIQEYVTRLTAAELEHLALALPSSHWSLAVEPTSYAEELIEGSQALSQRPFGLTPAGYRLVIGDREIDFPDRFLPTLYAITERSRSAQVGALAGLVAGANAINETPFWLRRPQGLESEIENLRDRGRYRVAFALSPDVRRLVSRMEETRLRENLVRLRLAARSYRLRTGQAPGDVSDLTPNFLDKPLINPFTGRPLELSALTGLALGRLEFREFYTRLP